MKEIKYTSLLVLAFFFADDYVERPDVRMNSALSGLVHHGTKQRDGLYMISNNQEGMLKTHRGNVTFVTENEFLDLFTRTGVPGEVAQGMLNSLTLTPQSILAKVGLAIGQHTSFEAIVVRNISDKEPYQIAVYVSSISRQS